MKVAFGMPEVLVLFSLFMYSQNFWFSILAFCAGLILRLFAFAMTFQEKRERNEIITASLATLGSLVKQRPQQKSTTGDNGRFH